MVDLLVFENRRDFLIQFQQDLIKEFGEEDYNVFIFGSFVRDDFHDGSDIDLAVYSSDSSKLVDLAYYIRKYLDKALSISHHLILIGKEAGRYIALAPLSSPWQFTDYYPEDLRAYFYTLLWDWKLHEDFRKETEWIHEYRNRRVVG